MRTMKQTPGVTRDPYQLVAQAARGDAVLPARADFYDLIKLSPTLAGGIRQIFG